MSRVETLKDFYERKYDFAPDSLRQSFGHFNVFRLEPFRGTNSKPVPYKKRDYYKITLLTGKNTIEYADQAVEIEKQALVFSSPLIPYRWQHSEEIHQGYFCIFDQAFFHQHGTLNHYSLFQPEGNHVFELSDEETAAISARFERMTREINSEYEHKYDLLRTIVQEMVHFALKKNPAGPGTEKHPVNAAQRISHLFLELLERQFPIDDTHQTLQLRSPSDFAQQLNVHVNHLNRAIKDTTGKTTSQIIAERVVQESKIILRQTPWSVSEIAYALGFNQVTHFNNFFKKHVAVSPMKFRNV